MNRSFALVLGSVVALCASLGLFVLWPDDAEQAVDTVEVLPSSLTASERRYEASELRDGPRSVLDTGDDFDQLVIGTFESQLLTPQAALDRMLRRARLLEPATTMCLESEAELSHDVAQQFAQAMISEAFGFEAPDGSMVVAFPDMSWSALGPSNPAAERAADGSSCSDAVSASVGAVFGGPVGERMGELTRSGRWALPTDFETEIQQALAHHCGPDPFDTCLDEDGYLEAVVPLYQDAIRLNLDELD